MSEYRSNRQQPANARRNRFIYITLIIVLLGVNAFLFYNNMNTRDDRELLKQERTELLEQKAAFERKVDSLKGLLIQSRGLTVELDSIINDKITELDALKINFNRNLANKDLEINDLKEDLNERFEEIEEMSGTFTTEIEEWKARYNEAQQEKQALNQVISSKNTEIRELEKRVSKGAVLTAVNMRGFGIQYRSNEREKETDRAKRVDKLQLCFNLAENRIAETGYKDLYLRILTPEGTTMAQQSMGSGTFTLAESGESSLFTKKVSLAYDPTEPEKEFCADWYQDNEFVPGIYTFELYQNGYLIGTTSIELRKGGLF